MKRKGTNTVADEAALLGLCTAFLPRRATLFSGGITNPIPTLRIIIGICYQNSQSIKPS